MMKRRLSSFISSPVHSSKNRLPEGIRITAGHGGDGAISFFRGNRQPQGPPSGGSGGRGGNVYIVASKEVSTLGGLVNRYKAENGKSGGGMHKHGADGKDFIIHVPVGTKIKQVHDGSLEMAPPEPMSDLEKVKQYYKFKSDYTPQLDRVQMLMERIPVPEPLFEGLEMDLVTHEDRKLVAKGGKGGFGNPHFVTPQIPGPSIAGKGIKGTSITLEFELKTLADAGLVGLPNAGKSTLLAAVSDAHPKIAPYPFTTMNPYIGTIDFPDLFSITMADIPGLIKGAHRNVGLGHKFLRHVERSKMLVYVIDLAGEAPWTDLAILQSELEAYSQGLTNRPSIVVANKADLGDKPRKNLERLKTETSLPIVPISAKDKKNILMLTTLMRRMIEQER